MNYPEAVAALSVNTTKSGNYKKQAVLDLIKTLTTKRPCFNCEGTGETYLASAFGVSGGYHKCRVCDGTGRL